MEALRTCGSCDESVDIAVPQAAARSPGEQYIYALKNEKQFEWSAVHQFAFTALALPLVFAAPGDKSAHPLYVGRPSRSCAEVVDLDDAKLALRAKVSSGVELFLEEGPCLAYRGEELAVPKARMVRSQKRKPLSSMISIEKKKKTATSCESDEEHGVRRVETKEVRMEVEEEEVKRGSEELETENIKKVGTGKKEKSGNRKN